MLEIIATYSFILSKAILYIILLVVFVGFSFFTYKYTLPQVDKGKKFLLSLIRSLIVSIILILLFEPIIVEVSKRSVEAKTLVLIDNSKSILVDDGSMRKNNLLEALNYVAKNLDGNKNYYLFGKSLKKIESDSLVRVNFTDYSTNFQSIFDFLGFNTGINSIIILSDGGINEGSNPFYSAEKLSIPVYAFGVGDTSSRKDIAVVNVNHNDYLYVGTPAEISTSISSTGFSGKSISINLLDGGNVVEKRSVTLIDGIINCSFTFTPITAGEHKLTISAEVLEGEFSKVNNNSSFFVKVRGSKVKILIVSGAPNADLSFLKNTLEADKNFSVSTLTQISGGSILEKANYSAQIDSADIIYFTSFPNRESKEDLLDKIAKKIVNQNTPFFYLYNNEVDISKLKFISGELPFGVNRQPIDYVEVQPSIELNKNDNPLLQSNLKDNLATWNALPPVLQPNVQFSIKPESEVLSYIKIGNKPIKIPLIITRNLGGKRSVAILAKDIWKWKLQTSNKQLTIFDDFNNNVLRWLNSADQKKQFSVKTNKQFYAKNEEINFTAQVYDESYNPLNTAIVKLKILSENKDLLLNSIGSGLYTATASFAVSKDYQFVATADNNGKSLGTQKGTFNVGDMDLEMTQINMDKKFLTQLSEISGGKFYFAKGYKNAVDEINKLNKRRTKVEFSKSDYKLWSNKYVYAFVIFLFALEWFLRKRQGML